MANRDEAIEKLKREIEESPIFHIDREENPGEYRKLAYALIGRLYEYASAVNPSRYGDMGLEIVNTAHSCLKSYRPDSGPFLNYFMRSLKRSAGKELYARMDAPRRGGMVIPEQVRNQIFQLEAVARAMKMNYRDPEVVAAASASMELSKEQLWKLVELNERSSVVSGSSREDGEGPGDPLDNLSDGTDLEELVIGRQNGGQFLQRVEERFLRCREGQREVLSMLLTARIAGSDPETVSQCRKAAFFNEAFYNECLRDGKVPTAREIADRVERREESVSRTLSRFLESLEEDQ